MRELPMHAWITYLSAVYLLISLAGVWAAPDPTVAWERFGLLAVGVAIALAIGWAGREPSLQGHICFAVGLLAGIVSALFVGTLDGTSAAARLLPPGSVGLSPIAALEGVPARLQPNAAGGALALALPFGIAALIRGRGRFPLLTL